MMASHLKELVDYEGLIRKEGDWKNMQDIICRTFRALVDANQQQSDMIQRLERNIQSLKTDIQHRPTWDEIERLVETKVSNDRKKHTVLQPEIDQIKLQMAHMKSELEKKPSINFLEMSLNKKADRTDVVTKSLGQLSKAIPPAVEDDLKRVKLDILQVKADMENVSDMVTSTFQAFDIPRLSSDVSILKSQGEHFISRLQHFHTKEEIVLLLQQKASRSEVDVQISQKADSVTFSKALNRIEQALEQHEKLITSLRFRSNDSLLMSGGLLSNGEGGGDRRKSDTPFDFENGLKNGRLESIVIEIWNNMNGLQSEVKNIRKELQGCLSTIDTTKFAMEKVANADKVELLAAVIEEQRQRIDSVIQGTTKITPIFKTLARFEEKVKEMNDFLVLPQVKSFPLLLGELNHQIDVLKDEVALSREFFESETKQRVDSLTAQMESLETRWITAQNDREKLQFILSFLDLHGTKFNNLRDIADTSLELRALITGEGLSTEVGSKSIFPRLKTLESRLISHDRAIEKYKTKVRNLKAALITLELQRVPVGKAEDVDLKDEENANSSNVDRVQLSRDEEVENAADSNYIFSEASPSFKNNTTENTRTATSTVVDFDSALNQLLTSIDEIQFQVKKSSSPTKTPSPVSLNEVDIRLQELQNQKERLRKMLLSQI